MVINWYILLICIIYYDQGLHKSLGELFKSNDWIIIGFMLTLYKKKTI